MNVAAARLQVATWLVPFTATLAAMFCLQLSNLGFAPLLPSLQQDLAMSFTQLGLFTGLYGLLAMLLSVPAGLAARRFGEKRVLVLGLVGVAILETSGSAAWRGCKAPGHGLVQVFFTSPERQRRGTNPSLALRGWCSNRNESLRQLDDDERDVVLRVLFTQELTDPRLQRPGDLGGREARGRADHLP